MLPVSEPILNTLKCYLCDGYLNAKPVLVQNNKQICAKCYKILPEEEKVLCQRQIAYEAVANYLQFPCRYHKMGCTYTYKFNQENGHEIECKKRHFTVPDLVVGNLDNESSGSQIELVHITQNRHNSHLESNVMPALNSHSYENLYCTLDSTRSIKCLNCSGSADKKTKNVCLFGHVTCSNCKSDMCLACVRNVDGNSRIACKNASKGCKELLCQSDVGFHRDNCEFNEISCPICEQKFDFNTLMTHLKNVHHNVVILSDEVSKTVAEEDQTFVMICHEGIFKCLTYNYVTSAEILVLYLGPCVKAAEFSFEVSVMVNHTTLKKKLACANWNNYMLAGGVNLNQKELKLKSGEPLTFSMNLKVVRTK